MKLQLSIISSFLSLFTLAQTQYLDPNFGQNGTVITDINNSVEDPHNVYLQANGKIVVTGDLEVNDNEDYMVVRYNANGTLDNTFGVGGIVHIDFSSGDDDVARGLHFLPNGKIIILGRKEDLNTSKEAVIITRLNSDGSLDSTFGVNGYIQHSQPFDLNMSEVLVLSSGKYLSCGYINDGSLADLILARFNADGTLDNAFGNGGYVIKNVLNSFDFIREVRELPNGDLIGTGWSNNSAANGDFPILIRLKANGSADPTFGNNGVIQVNLNGVDDIYRNIQLVGTTHFITSGKIQLAGQDEDLVVSKYSINGKLDTLFGNKGHFIYDYTGDDEVGDGLAVQADGKILVGFTAESSSSEDVALLRLLPNGTLDSSYAQNGVFMLDVNNEDNAQNIAMQANGLTLLVGTTNEGTPQQDLLLLRVLNPSTFDVDEIEAVNLVKVYPNPVAEVLEVVATGPKNEKYEGKLYTMEGQLVKAFEFHKKTSVYLKDLSAGSYVLSIRAEGKIATYSIYKE